jgi:hypothetical protein
MCLYSNNVRLAGQRMIFVNMKIFFHQGDNKYQASCRDQYQNRIGLKKNSANW